MSTKNSRKSGKITMTKIVIFTPDDMESHEVERLLNAIEAIVVGPCQAGVEGAERVDAADFELEHLVGRH